jgi:filamentous hemagglutinin family protein
MLRPRPSQIVPLMSAPLVSVLVGSAIPLPTQAQSIPDSTLGAERSILLPNVEVRGEIADLIEGGAIRGTNLFHSFTEFNVLASQRLYFANPLGIESILSRVTGSNPSVIFGTLGVDGPADLFLINPNGIVFGETAVLDVAGSFYGTTATAIEIGEGVFSAVAPAQSQLLSVNPNTSFWNYLTERSGNVVNRGQLAVGGDLVLAGHSLDLQGPVAAAGDVSLLATDTVQIRDTAAVPFIGYAGGDLLAQGNQQVNVSILTHPESGLFSGGDMVLRSANPVLGDAHFAAGGSLRFEQLDGTLGDLFSPTDPILYADGDVQFGDATVTSLHILAGGSVTSTGTITITGAGPAATTINPTTTPDLASITLSDGTTLVIDGSARPTLDIRAGIDWAALGGSPGNRTVDFDPPNSVGTATSSDITLNQVQMNAPDGIVFLSNQFSPNLALAAGTVEVEALSLDDISGDFTGNSGSILIDARGDIVVTDEIATDASSGDVGSITLLAGNDVLLDGGILFSNLLTGDGAGNDIRITATNVAVTNGAQLQATTEGEGNAGNVVINARDRVIFSGSTTDGEFSSAAFSRVGTGATGDAGDVVITANTLEVSDEAFLTANSLGMGNAGNVVINVQDSVLFDNGDATSVIGSEATGNGGNVEITTNSLEVINGGTLDTSVEGNGNAGSVVINARDTVVFDGTTADGRFGSAAFSRIDANATGVGGNVVINAHSLQVSNGARLTASTLGNGNAGNVVINAQGSVSFDGTSADGELVSAAFSNVGPDAVGDGGNVEIVANSLAVMNGAQLLANTEGEGNAGNVVINASDRVVFSGRTADGELRSAAFSRVNTDATGDAGDVVITANTLEVSDEAFLTADSLGIGNAGNVVIDVQDVVLFDNGNATSFIGPDAIGNGGNVEITTNFLDISNNALLGTSTLGGGNAGNVVINARENIFLNESDILSGVASGGIGNGGNIEIITSSLAVTNGSQLIASTEGEGNAGNVVINASDRVIFEGRSIDRELNSGALSRVDEGATGDGGDVVITTNSLEVSDRAFLTASSSGNGDAGDIEISTNFLDVNGNARIISDTAGNGDAGNILVDAQESVVSNNGFATSFVGENATGSSGNIEISTDSLTVTNDSLLAASTLGNGNAGNVIINVAEDAFFDSSGAFSMVNPGATGNGGNVVITAHSLTAINDASLTAETSANGS